jgi:outer membrane receptor protein involved in Fe transport
MSALKNYDLRLDWTPYPGGLVSASYFYKDVTGPIEYVQRYVDFSYTTAVNYPSGTLSGLEFEVRQDLGHFWEELEGLSVGANATFIESEVLLPEDEQERLELPSVQAPMKTRHMSHAPQHLYNFYVTYDIEEWGTKLGLFYTVRGDTLIAGAGTNGAVFVPNIYEAEYGTLNFTLSQKLGDHCTLSFKAKNLTNPEIQTVYRSIYIGPDVVKTSYTKGMEFSLSLGWEF